MSKYPNLIGTVLIFATAFVPTSTLWAKASLTIDQEKAKGRCARQFMFCVDECADVHCQRKCEFRYNKCMDDAGIPRLGNPPPKAGTKLYPGEKANVPAVEEIAPQQ